MLLPLLLLAARLDPANTAIPYRQPQLAAAHGQVAMTFGAGSAIYYAASKDQGRTFGAPVKVADVGAVALGRHRGPRLAILKHSLVISAIVADRPANLPVTGNLKAWRSQDGGATWQAGPAINDVPAAAREGLHAMAAAPDGTLFAAWLDLRDKGTRLYGSRSTDGGATWRKNVLLYESPGGTICQCCHPSLAFDERGKLYAMWRNALDGSRDLYLTSSTDGEHFVPAQKLGAGTWKLNACPMDGGAFSVNQGQITSAWRRDKTVYLATGNQPEREIGLGKDVSLAQGQRGTYLAWTQESSLQVLTPADKAPQVLAAAGAFVHLVKLPDGAVLAAWESNGAIETKRLD
ncbi:MAG: glycoside hydrolase [Bryobacteraceae bacterium]|nr:glycoside hydrolase [Bryobacteraceae bacterium]